MMEQIGSDRTSLLRSGLQKGVASSFYCITPFHLKYVEQELVNSIYLHLKRDQFFDGPELSEPRES